jgi:hypothetical protein
MRRLIRRAIPALCVLIVTASAGATRTAAESIGMAADNGTKSVTVFDADADAVLATISIPDSLLTSGCAVMADHTLGFVTDTAHRVWVIDLRTSPPILAGGVNPIPVSNSAFSLALTRDQRFLLVAGGSQAQPISVVDIAARAEVSTFHTGADSNSITACDDGSVLVTSWRFGRVQRLTMDEFGTLSDTGETLFLGARPNNVHAAPGGGFGVVVTRERGGTVESFTIPGLDRIDARPLSGSFGVSAAFHGSGEGVYVRSNGSPGTVDLFGFDPESGRLSEEPIWTVAVSDTPPTFGIDQLAVHPDGLRLYVPQPNSLHVLDAMNGTPLWSIEGEGIASPRGIAVATSSLRRVEIVVRPGGSPNSINLNARGVLPVAILSSERFDALRVDEETVLFADPVLWSEKEGLPAMPIRSAVEDVNGNGLDDLVLFFSISDLSYSGALDRHSVEALLTGETFDGTELYGVDSVRVVQPKKR